MFCVERTMQGLQSHLLLQINRHFRSRILRVSKLAFVRNHSGPVHTMLEEFQKGAFTLKTHEMFSIHTAPEKFENATITDHFGFVFEGNSSRKIT